MTLTRSQDRQDRNPPGRPPHRRGYSTPADLRDVIAAAHATSLPRTVATALVDVISVSALAVGAGVLGTRTPGWGELLIAVFAITLAGRQIRAIECLVHEASHLNWNRRGRRLNDILAIVVTGLPTGLNPSAYRRSHLQHHGRFGTAADPDLRKYEQLAFEDLDRGRLSSFTRGCVHRFISYQADWLVSVRRAPWSVVIPLAWAAGAIIGPAWLVGGTDAAVLASGIWICAHTIVWPAVRFVGESGEHAYRGTTTVFEATVSSLGLAQRLMFHPHGDGYHTVHHMWPGVPHFRIGRLHRVLIERDPEFAARLRFRTRVLEDVRTGFDRHRPR